MGTRQGWALGPFAVALVAIGCGSSDDDGGSNASSGGSGGIGVSGGAGMGGASGALSGSSGASGGASAGAAGSGPPGMHCSPGAPDPSPFFSGMATACYGDRFAFGLPNPLDVTLSNFTLPAPMTAGQPHAISIENSGAAPMNIELWGTDAECGVASELLWWGEYDARIHCAEFTPTMAHSHVLYVHRLLEDASNYFVQTGAVTLCAGGSCPGGADGQGRAPGSELVAPLGGIPRTGGSAVNRGYAMELAGYGTMVLIREGSQQPEGTPEPVSTGFFRLNADDPYGDGWYCVGAGSSITELPDDAGYAVSLGNITRLGSCEGRSGSGTASVTIADFEADITSSFGELAGSTLNADQDCLGSYCRFSFSQSPSYSWLYPIAAADLGNFAQPTATPTDLLHAAWFVQPDAGEPISMTCAGAGSIRYEPDVTTSIELASMSDFVTCPGEAIEQNAIELLLY